MKEKWLNDLQARIQSEYKVSPPEGLLDDIKAEMQRRGLAPEHAVEPKGKALRLWIYRAMSAAAVVVIGLYLFNMPTERSPLPKPSLTAILAPRSNTVPNLPIETIHTAHPSHVARMHSSLRENAPAANDLIPTDSEALSRPSQAATDTPQAVKHKTWEYRQPDYTLHTQPATYLARFSVGPSYSGTGGALVHSQSSLLATADPYGDYSPEFAGDTKQRNVNETEKVKQCAKHRPVVRFGLTVRYNISEHWALQSGIIYSRLSSDFSYKVADEHFDVEQTLHYVGLPINVSYSLVRTKRFNVYAMAGGEIEKLVKGRSAHKLGLKSSANQSPSSVTEHRPVFSANAAIGGEYLFTDKVSTYVEPGLNYHFNNGSNVENVYKDKPANFNLNVGIRVALNN